MWRRWIPLFIAVFIIGLDQFTKHLIRINIPVGTSLEEFFRVRIVNIQNTGSAFGLFTGQTLILTILATIGLIVIILFYRQIGKNSWLAAISLGFIFGGAVGNQIDRIVMGFVTDFIYVHLWGDFYWPAFNVADSAVTIGTLLLIWFIITGFSKKDESKPTTGS